MAAKIIKVPPRRINEIVLGKRAITADTDLRLARYLRLSQGFFLQLETDHDLMSAAAKSPTSSRRSGPGRQVHRLLEIVSPFVVSNNSF